MACASQKATRRETDFATAQSQAPQLMVTFTRSYSIAQMHTITEKEQRERCRQSPLPNVTQDSHLRDRGPDSRVLEDCSQERGPGLGDV